MNYSESTTTEEVHGSASLRLGLRRTGPLDQLSVVDCEFDVPADAAVWYDRTRIDGPPPTIIQTTGPFAPPPLQPLQYVRVSVQSREEEFTLYIGRIVCIALSKEGRLCAAYRVSSRSFPNRRAIMRENAVAILPKPGHEGDVQKNPYIAYNCARIVCDGMMAVVTNGSHTDPIAEKLQSGMSVRDALALSLLALDYEHDQYNTPRIAAVADRRDRSGWLATVRDNGLNVCRMPLAPGKHFYVATYEENDVNTAQSGEFPSTSAGEACAFMLGGGVFAQRTNPVSAVAAMEDGADFDFATQDATQP